MKKQRAGDGLKVLLDVVKESSDWFPLLKSALGGMSALIKHYEVLVERGLLCVIDLDTSSTLKTSRFNPSWTGSNKISLPQRLKGTLRKWSDA